MDVSKPGSGGGIGAPVGEAGGASGGGGARFNDVMEGGGAGQAGGAQGPAKTPFTSPILDNDIPGARKAESITRRKVGGPEAGVQADHHRRPSLQMIGERGISPAAANQPPQPVSFRDLANNTMKAESKIDAMIEAARNGKTFSANDLLVMQVEVFRYSQTVEVMSKTTEKVVGGIKQTLGTQV